MNTPAITAPAGELPQTVAPAKAQQAGFAIGFIWAALSIALTMGFAIAAHLAFVIGFDFPLGQGFASFIQVHGHAQLMGWTGLFIISVTLHFIPRLIGTPIAQPRLVHWVLGLLVSGLIVRGLAQSTVPYLQNSPFFGLVNSLNSVSGFLEWSGLLIYFILLIRLLAGAGSSKSRPALKQVRPFFAMMILGFALYASFNLVLLTDMVLRGAMVLNQAWNELAIQIFVGLVLLPVAMAFSVRMFPLLLRLPAVDWPVRALAYAYGFGFCLQVLPSVPVVARLPSQLPLVVGQLGAIIKGCVILWFIWQLDILTRLRQPWTVKRSGQPAIDRRPTRSGLPDYGNFGRFDRLVYSAYSWLVVGVMYEILSSLSSLFGQPLLHGSSVIRHIYLLGFITLLILGLAVRMIPSFVGKRRVFSPRLVDATFWLGNAAVLLRIVPMMIPVSWYEAWPISVTIARTGFGLSGIVALAAICCLAINLRKTIVGAAAQDAMCGCCSVG